MGEKYNPKEESSYLQYLDANNLYGWAMTQNLPVGGFKWIEKPEIFNSSEMISRLAEQSEKDKKGYILEVDVEYPKELHDEHNDFPFMCEKKEINKVKMLVPNLSEKKKYVVHIRALDQALKHGLILEKVHRVIKFDQETWLKPYIDFNTNLRAKSKNEFEKEFFKLMNNSVFGKTMENIREHKDVKLVTNRKAYLRQVMKPNFKSGLWFSENLMGCKMGKIKIVMNKPVYLGAAILDLSKTLMYEFHYDYMKPKYKDKLQLCYMDTDSFVYHIKTEDFYVDIAPDVKERFDTSGYDKKDCRPLTIGLNKKVIGLMKDELGGMIMTEFCALRNKMYAYKKMDNSEEKRCKGIKKCVVEKTLGFDDYKRCLFDEKGENVYRTQILFQNKKHEIYTCEVNKIALNRDDEKRIIQPDGISTLARGYFTICSYNG